MRARSRSWRSASRAVLPRRRPAGLISERVLDLFPRRERFGSKFDSGVVAIAGGSRGLTGAPTLAALAAARAGAGYVQVAVPESAQPALALRLLEQMAHGLPEDDGAHTPDGVEPFARAGRARRRRRARPGPRPRRLRGGVRAFGGGCGGRAAADRRRWPQRPCRRAGVAARAVGADGAHPARRRARPAAGARLGGGRRPPAGVRARSRGAQRRRRPAEGRRHGRRRARWPGRGQPGRHAGACHGRDRRRALRPDRRPAREGAGAVRGGRAGRARARPRRPRGGRRATAPTTRSPATWSTRCPTASRPDRVPTVPKTVREIMETDTPTVAPERQRRDRCLR